MSLVINNNLMAANTARILNNTYDRLSTSVQRLSSGLRINSAADDAAGLAIRELMRADIATMQQGIRNAADAISMIQTADGAMAVIDEKLVRMKELANQAATGTYTTLQREIINSEYQAMAAEIDRIAASTNFNGVKLLDGSMSNLHGGQGMKIHFGVGNNPDEDYYFITTGDVRATSDTGLRIGGDAKNDIWGQGAAGATGLAGPGCCTAGYDSLEGPAGFKSGQTFSYGYNWDWMEDDDPDLLSGKYLAGRYTVSSTDSLQDLINKVNKGTQSRVGVELDYSALAAAVKNGGTAAVCVGDEAYIFGSATVAGGTTIEPAVSGVTYKYLAKGNYLGEGFLSNIINGSSGYGFGLTSAQISALQKAGIDVSPLGLTATVVSASGSSTVNSAQAKTALLVALTKAWDELKLNGFSSLTTQSGVTSGYAITSSIIMANATGSNVTSGDMTAKIVADQTLTVHTKIWADENGNWTDDERIAKALGLEEVVFHITNQDSALYKTSLLAGGFKSNTYAVNANSTIAYVGNNQLLINAGINAFTSASLAGPLSATGANAAAASANLLTEVQNQFKAKYATLTQQLKLEVSAGGGITAGKTIDDILDSAGITVFVTNNTSAVSGAHFQVSANVWWDANGNFTTDKAVADEFGLTRVVYDIIYSGTTAGWKASAVGGTGAFTSPDPIVGLNATTTTAAQLLTAINASIAYQIDQRQTAATGLNGMGRLTLSTFDGSGIFKPTAANLDTYKTSPTAQSTSNDLTVTVDIAGKTNTISSTYAPALSELDRFTTTLAEILPAVQTAIAQILTVAQNSALGNNLVNMGRIVTEAATPPNGADKLSEVDSLTQSTSFHSGTLDHSIATGTYADSGYVYSSATGYGLTSAEFANITRAGLDLANLLLKSAMVTASATSKVGSASARALLIQKLNEMWTALALGNYSALTISGGLFTGYAEVDSAKVKANSAPGTLEYSATLNGNLLKEQKSLTVHTGIYSDANGNWTDDAVLAKDLGLNEITYSVTNNNLTWYTTSAEWKSTDYVVSGTMLATSATMAALALASATGWAALAFNSAQILAKGSGATYAAASANLLLSAQQLWAAKYKDAHSSLTFSSADNGASIPAPDFALIAQSATPGNCTSENPTGTINSGSTLVVHTGIYADAVGNWTDNSVVAQIFGLTEIVYDVRGSGNTYIVSGAGIATTETIGLVGIGQLATPVRDYIRTYLTGLGTTNTNAGKISFTKQSGPTAPDKYDLTTVMSTPVPHTINTVDSNMSGYLSISMNIAGVDKTVFDSWNPPQLSATLTMTKLATALNDEIYESLTALAGAVTNYSGMGKIEKTKPTPPGGPTDVADLVKEKYSEEDIYKDASSQQTVVKTGIVDKTKHVTVVASAGTAYTNADGISNFGAWALASAINHNPNSQFWAMVQSVNSDGKSADMVYIFTKDGGDYNSLLACDVADGDIASRAALDAISFENTETDVHSQSGTNFSLGGQNWATFKPIQTRAGMGKEVWNLTLHGRDVGKERDLWIAAVSNGENEISTPGLDAGIINGLDRYSFVEIQNADNGPWTGAEVRTQSAAQEALDAINDAMERKDKVRADLGALQNRLENTITNLEIQMEALQSSESRISDADMATEMTEFVRNQVLAQAAIAMLSQANSLPQMALTLLNG